MVYKKTAFIASLFVIPATVAMVSEQPVSANTYYHSDWQVQNVENLIDQINPSSTTYDYYLAEAHKAYNALSYSQQTEVRNTATLFYYLGSIENYQHILSTFTTKMTTISARKDTFIRDIEEANRYYNSLTSVQKSAIPNYLYIQLQNYVENVKKMEAVQLSFEQLNMKDWNYISNYQAAMKAYDSLPYDYRMLLSTIANEKVREYETYHSPAYNRSVAQQVITAISNLSTSSSKQQVEDVRAQYNELSALQQSFVKNINDLVQIEEVQRNIPYGWDPYYYEDEEQDETPTYIEVTKQGQTYSIVMPVSDMNRYTPTKITVSDNISISIPRNAIPVSDNNAVVAMTIDEFNGETFSFSASMYNENVQFASYIDIEVNRLPATATILRLDNLGEYVATPYTRVGNKHIIKTQTSGEYKVTNESPFFLDIRGDGHRYEIEQLAKRKIVSGVEKQYFKPGKHVTMAQYAAMVSRAMALTSDERSTYRDVQGKWYESSIQSLLEAGILEHKQTNFFNAEQTVTRKQAAILSIRMLQHAGINMADPNFDKVPFKDINNLPASERQLIALTYEFGIFGGKENGQFDPNGKLTRSQMAKVLHRTLQIAKMV